MTEHSTYNLVVWTVANLQVICVIKDITWTQNVRTLIDLYLSVFILSLTKSTWNVFSGMLNDTKKITTAKQQFLKFHTHFQNPAGSPIIQSILSSLYIYLFIKWKFNKYMQQITFTFSTNNPHLWYSWHSVLGSYNSWINKNFLEPLKHITASKC